MSAISPLRILILEDRLDDAEIVVRQLRRTSLTYSTQIAQNEAEFLAALSPPPDLVLADYQLPGYDALGALRALRDRGLEVPVIVVSGTIGEEAAVECVLEGAIDYLLKDRLGRLGHAIVNAIEKASLRQQQAHTAAALRESEERYRSLVEEAPHPMWVVDAKTLRFLTVNRKAISHYGYSHEEFLALSLLDIRPPEDVADTLRGINLVLAGASRTGIRRHLTKAGKLLIVSVASHRVIFDGRPALLAIIDDITDRHRLEEQLRQAQKIEAIGHLAGGIAHDFNNLLTAILGYSELLNMTAQDRPDILRLTAEITRAGERAAQLTNQLLAFGRQQALHPRIVDLNEVVSGVEGMLRRLIGEDLGFSITFHPAPCPVLVDPGQMEQVIVNLAVNARDAMPTGGQLVIHTAVVEAGDAAEPGYLLGPRILLAVSDTGCGMSDEIRSRIFEPFFTTKEPGKGTGLGLATVYGIVHQSGGQLEVVSEPGRGSSFRIFLPRAAGALDEARPTAQPTAPGGQETVLVLEDDSSVRQLTSTLLQDAGYTVLTADTATAAIAIAERYATSIDLLLSDVVLPEMSGPEAAARFLALRPGARLLFTSGYSGDTAASRELLAKGGRLLGKPFSRQSLLESVRGALDGAA